MSSTASPTFTPRRASVPVLEPLEQIEPKRDAIHSIGYSTFADPENDSLGSWGEVLQRIIKAIVSIKGTTMRAFDTEIASVYQGTGFVVDRTRGIILSNRHMVQPGPATATAIFGNY